MSNEDLVDHAVDDEQELVETKALSPRHELFCKTYVSNGGNATRAYIACGYSPDGAIQNASRLMTNDNVTKRIAELQGKVHQRTEMTLEKTLQEIAAVAQFDQRKLFYEDGTPVPRHLLDDDTSAAISHEGKNGIVPFNKLSALDMSMKYLGAYEKDNSQKSSNLAIQIILE
jgi:hypothetical protein